MITLVTPAQREHARLRRQIRYILTANIDEIAAFNQLAKQDAERSRGAREPLGMSLLSLHHFAP
jgi:siroheme synthase (precorrin-2 oxidase/ferrochelatase)